jgi:hypothetical protein
MKPLLVALMATLPFLGVFDATARADDVTDFITAMDEQDGTGDYYSAEELDRLLAPIALYQDDLLAQVLMASTYPLDVVEAARWSQANAHLRPEDIESAMLQKPWDPSVKSLTAVPQVLQQMNENLQWTRMLGDAFLQQQQDVMNTIQALRNRALAAGSLSSNANLVVKREISSQGNVVIIESPQPDVIYIPSYNPTVVYGSWWYASPPYYIYPPAYVYPSGIGFITGVAVGAAIWGGFNWRRHDVNINVNRYNRYNRTTINNGSWHHNPSHRRGVDYRGDYNSRPHGSYPNNRVNHPHEDFRGDFRGNDGRNSLNSDSNGNRNGDRGGRQTPGAMPHQPPHSSPTGLAPNHDGSGTYRPPQRGAPQGSTYPTEPHGRQQGFQPSPGSYPHQGGRPVQGDQQVTPPQYQNRGQPISPPHAVEQGGAVQHTPHHAYPGSNNSGGMRPRSPQENPGGTLPQYQHRGHPIAPAPAMPQQGGSMQPQPQQRNAYSPSNNAGDSSGGRGQFNQPGMSGGNRGGHSDFGRGGSNLGGRGGGDR